jgi:peptidyl-prolyl cis-trans isomerase D
MFEFVRSHNRLLFFVLVLLIFPSFVFFGVQGYTQFNDPGNERVATVDSNKITQAEWDAVHRRQVEQARQSMPGADARFFDTPEVKKEVLDSIVRERVLLAAANQAHLSVGNERLQRELMAIPQLASLKRPDGSFDVAAYRALVEAQGQTPERFEASMRQDMTLRQVLGGVAASGLPGGAVGKAALDALLQQREVQVLRLNAKDFSAGIAPTDAEMAAYHKANEAQFKAPEQAQIEYIVLDIESLKKDMTVAEADLKKYYEENAARYTAAEERRASHILVKADKEASAAGKAKAKEKAEKLLAEVRKTPASFADLAKKNSDDPGSAEKGGDLDFFGRGAMVKPFEDTVFSMKPGEISNVVATDFGFHIIRLDALRGGEKKPFEAVKAEIENEVKKSLALKKYTELAEQFGNTVYEQPDSLQPVVDKFKLTKQTATVQRAPAPGATGALASQKLLDAVFGTDALKNKRNTEAVEVGPSQLASARVAQHQPARVQPLAEVQAQVRERVIAEQAAAKARKAGEAKLAEVKGGAEAAGLGAALLLSRSNPQGQPKAVVDAVLKADTAKLPAWIGVDMGSEGYALVKLAAVKSLPSDSPEFNQLLPRYAQAWSAAEADAYYEALKRRKGVKLEPKVLETVAAASAPAN